MARGVEGTPDVAPHHSGRLTVAGSPLHLSTLDTQRAVTVHNCSPLGHALLCAISVLALIAACSAGETGAGGSIARGDTVLIDGAAPSCSACTLVLSDSVRLGTPDDAEIPQRDPSQIVRDSRGVHYIAFANWGNKPVLRYSERGEYMGKLGAYGQGPGEYDMISKVFTGPADSVFVLNWGSRSGQVFAPDGRYARDVPPARTRIIGPARDGSGDVYAFSSASIAELGRAELARPGSENLRPFLLRIGSDGAVRDSFQLFSALAGVWTTGPVGGPRHGVPYRMEAYPSIGWDGSIWTQLGANVRLERHSRDGRSEQVIGLSLPGFYPPVMSLAQADTLAAEQERAQRDKTPIASLRGLANVRYTVQVDSLGLIWVQRTIRAPSADTITVERNCAAADEAPGECTTAVGTRDRQYHVVVDVIDPLAGKLIARTTLPFAALPVAPGFVGRVRSDADGHYVVHVYRITLTRG